MRFLMTRKTICDIRYKDRLTCDDNEGFKEEESKTLANLIADLLDAPGSEEVLESVRKSVGKLTEKFPVYVK